MFGESNKPSQGLEVYVSKGTDMLGREATRIDLASDKYTCDTCDRKLPANEGYLLTTKQVVLSVESWRRVIDKWKPQCAALSKGHAREKTVLVTKTKERQESITKSLRQVIARLKLECPDQSAAALLEGSIFLRGSSQTPWVICGTCAGMFTFQREQARLALEKYRQSGEFPKGEHVLNMSSPKSGDSILRESILLESKDDDAFDAMLKAISAALQPDFDARVRPIGDPAVTVENILEAAETWLQYYVASCKRQQNQDKEWAIYALFDLSLKEPARVWKAVQHINSLTIPDNYIREIVDINVGASLLANILFACDDSLWESILAAAAESTRLCRQLRKIVADSVDNAERWQELQSFLEQRK